MAVDDVYQVTITAQAPGGFYQNTYAFNRTSATEPTQADFQTLSDLLKDLYRSDQYNGLTYRTWRARQVRGSGVTWPSGSDCNPTGGALFEGNHSGVVAGGNPGLQLPPQCAMVTTHKTATIGRRARGRTYAFGWCEGDQADGVFSGTSVTGPSGRLTTFYASHAIAAPASGFRFGIWSYRTASGCAVNPATGSHTRVDAPNPAQAFTPCTAFLVRTTVYTQRRRVAGVGR